MEVYFHPAARDELDELPVAFELRPRGGRSRWRAFYRQVGEHMVIAAIGPEARVNSRGFARTVKAAQERLATL